MAGESGQLQDALGDRYIIERELGRGGMATVYLASDVKHSRPVAIKVLRPELAASLGTERFVREIEIAARLSHPHILPLFDSGRAGEFLYYVMPFVDGESLRQRLQRLGELPVEETIRITEQVASALAYAHERGVVHRDIKPENVLLTGDQAVVADFGIARALSVAGGDRLTATGLAIGTPAYISPEQAFGSEEVDGRTDIYALGCVVYEMVAGRAPFEGPTPQSVLARHAAESVPRLRAARPGVPLFLERAVERALAKDPAQRFSTAAEFAHALTTGTVVARAAGPRRRRWMVAAAAAVMLFPAGWAVRTTMGGPKIERLAVLPLANLTADTTLAYMLEGVHEALISELGQLGMPVIARTTMQRYQGTTLTISEIARELGVDAIVEGSFFRRGDSLEIAARLYDGRAERELWNGSYDGDLPNVAALYRGFARAIADQVRWKLTPQSQVRLASGRAVNPVVYEAYLKGMYILNRSRPIDDLTEVFRHFEEAVEANPADPLAYTGLAMAYVTLGHGPLPAPDVWPRARAAAERALRLDSTLAEVWSALAQVKYYHEWDWEGAERAFLRAIEINPSLPMTRYHYAWFLLTVGRGEEALVEHHRASQLDPLTPLFTVWIPGLYVGMGDHQRALIEARQLADRYPDHPVRLFVLGSSAAELGLFDEAIEAHEKMVSINPRQSYALAITYARAGRREDAERMVREIEARPATAWGAYGLAQMHAALGNREETLRWLEYEPRHAWWMGLSRQRLFDFVRDEPRFQAIVQLVNLPPIPARRMRVSE